MKNEEFLKKTFHITELEDSSAEHLSGIFAAKEAFFKAFNKKPEWLSIEIKKEDGGRPYFSLSSQFEEEIEDTDLSMSHEEEYAVAHVLIIKK